jgi:hypothetical protein
LRLSLLMPLKKREFKLQARRSTAGFRLMAPS